MCAIVDLFYLPQRKHRQGMFKLFSRITMRDMHLAQGQRSYWYDQ